MSDLAKFVAAAIRDKVVVDQQDEIQQLQKELQQKENKMEQMQLKIDESNPIRSVQLCAGDGADDTGDETGDATIYVQAQLNAQEVEATMDEMVDLFPNETDVCVTIDKFLNAQLRIDGQAAIESLGQQLQLTVERYFYCRFNHEHFCYLRAEQGPDLCLHLYAGPFTSEEYCQIVGLSSPHEFRNSAAATSDVPMDIHDGVARPIHTQVLSTRFGKTKTVKLVFEPGQCQCSVDFFFHHLRVAYAP